ncbi:MAG: SCO family protein, partial [Pseudomonadota bacterium]|nr:SCO family protein [Pseudomonadota bacterium]
MKRIDQKNPLPGHLSAAGQKPNWIKWLSASSIFLALLIVVFVLSARVAEKTVVGFPNFHDSEFALLDQNGETRFPRDFVGKPIALFFGFTYCPDICPTTLVMLTGIQDQLAA